MKQKNDEVSDALDDAGLEEKPGEGKTWKNYQVKCMCCNQKPTVGNSELCGPCFFGEADTVNGNW